MITLKVKQLTPGLPLPAYAKPGDSGLDVYAQQDVYLWRLRPIRFPLGIACELPPGYELQIRPRSGLSGAGILCQWGTVDNEYRGELAVVLIALSESYQIKTGDRIAQLVPAAVTRVEVIQVGALTPTVRGESGFGSSGR